MKTAKNNWSLVRFLKTKTALALVVVVILAGQTHGSDVVVYSSDFNGTVGGEWSNQSTAVSPIGSRQFLGRFNSESVRLTLSNLPDHTAARISFDLYVILSWDGNATNEISGYPIGPDIWSLAVDGTTLLSTTFANFDNTGARQAYPGGYPGGDFPARTGATENNVLGWTWGSYPGPCLDSIYHLSFNFPHDGSSLVFDFAAYLQGANSHLGLDPLDDESWGLDNLSVEVAPVPEPSQLGVFALATLVVAFRFPKRPFTKSGDTLNE